MINLIDFINKSTKNNLYEAFKITADTKINVKRDIDSFKNCDVSRVVSYINSSYHSWTQKHVHYEKMSAYKDKGSKPKRLVNSIKDNSKLVMRWLVAIDIDWIDCALVFRDEIIDREILTAEELDAYVVKKYLGAQNLKDQKETLEKYMDEIFIKY